MTIPRLGLGCVIVVGRILHASITSKIVEMTGAERLLRSGSLPEVEVLLLKGSRGMAMEKLPAVKELLAAFPKGRLRELYRTLDTPRLPLNRPVDGAPFATWPGVVRYAVTTPFMVTFWFGAVVILISLGTDTRDGAGVALASAAVVGSSTSTASTLPLALFQTGSTAVSVPGADCARALPIPPRARSRASDRDRRVDMVWMGLGGSRQVPWTRAPRA